MNALTIKLLATLTLTALASISLQAGAAEPAANPADNSGIRVSFDDLDFNNSAAVTGLYRRIQQSARLVCTDSSSPWDASRQQTIERCYSATIEKAVSEVNRPQLTALHRGESKPVLASK
jgi:UrcA family protein